MSEFNLIDEKWIPVRFPDGTRGELGIKDALLRSKEIAALEDPSPLVTASLHRFLLAVLYRALQGPTDIEQAKSLFRSGLPETPIKNYLKKWRHRFWLFDDKYPFAQDPKVPETEVEPWTKLTAEYNATANKVLFDHTDTTSLSPVPFASAAKYIIATLNFSVRGRRGYRPSPSSDGVICIPVGKNLEQTLLLSLVPYPNREVMKGDSSIWERDASTSAQIRAASGYADLYTWPARFMRLILDGGKCLRVAFVPGVGYQYKDSQLKDPMTPYYQDRKGEIKQIGWGERGFWRSFVSLLPDAGSREGLEPKLLNYIASLALSGLTKSFIPFLVISQKFHNASVEFWRMESFIIPLNLSLDNHIKSEIQDMLQLAEASGNILQHSIRDTGEAILTKCNRELLPDKRAMGKLKPGDLTKYAMTIGALSQYWSILESRSHEILEDYSAARDADDIRGQWLGYVRDALKNAWKQFAASVDSGDAWAIRALIKAEGPVHVKIGELKDENRKVYKTGGSLMSGFIEWLEKINADGRKARAVLRRSLAFGPGAWPQAFPYVEPFLTGEENQWKREIYYLVAGLWAAHWKEGRAGPGLPIGKACALLDKEKRPPGQQVSGTERRFITTLDSDPDQLHYRLRQLLSLLKDYPVDFENLLTGLLRWNDERKSTQNIWARDFYRSINAVTEQTTQEK